MEIQFIRAVVLDSAYIVFCRPLGWHSKSLAMKQAVVSSSGGTVCPGGGGGLWQAGNPDRAHPWVKGGSLSMRQSWRWAKAAAESGRAQPHA